MRYIPKTYDLFSNFFDEPFFSKETNYGLKTDVIEHNDHYELNIEAPGFKKEDLCVELKDGNLFITAHQNSEKEEKDDQGKIIRHERYYGSMSRSFYVGDNVHQEDIQAKYNDGILNIILTKHNELVHDETKKIAIE